LPSPKLPPAKVTCESKPDAPLRCNGTDHSLSACRKRTDPSNPTPYATCFVCLATGHLSAQCPQNVRGVYINGGACKICGDVKHRAKDCPKIKAKEEATEGDFGGGWEGRQVGADEDDFMVQSRERRPNVEGKRRKHAPANNGKREVHQKDPVGDGVGGVSGGVRKVETAAPKPKAKVVSF
jgi:zinc finger CCHC domain-containing protein 9